MSGDLWMGIVIVLFLLSFAVPIYAITKERTEIRHGRLEFLKWYVLYMSANLIGGLSGHYSDSDVLPLVALIISLLLSYPTAQSLVRRCRDAGWNKNWAYVIIIPYINGILAILMLFWAPKQEPESA